MGRTEKPCVFCAELAALGIRDEAAATIPDANPVSDGHALVVPVRHVSSIEELSDEEWSLLFAEVKRRSDEILARDDVQGINIGMNGGEAAGQTIDHVHVHLIPRRDGDCEDPRGGVRWVVGRGADYWSSGT